ncbi:MAG: hypothetical protein AAGJ46_18505, partial [Planctomycetota bacterium]
MRNDAQALFPPVRCFQLGRSPSRHSAFRTPNSTMPYFYNTPQDVQEMLDAIGVGSIDELLD